MSTGNALKQYILARRQLEPSMTVVEMVKDIRKIKKYSRKPYNSMHKAVSRVFAAADRKGRNKKRAPTVRTTNNIYLVKKILNKNNKTRKGSIRGIKTELKVSYNYHMSYGSIGQCC